MVDCSAIIFTLGALLIALNMSAMYSLLLFFTLIVFILQVVQYYIKMTTITSIRFRYALIC